MNVVLFLWFSISHGSKGRPLCYSNRWQLGLSRMVKIGDTTRHSWMGDDDMVINNTRHYLFPTFSANPLPNMSRSIVAKPGHSSKRSWGRTWRCSDLRVHKACGKSGVRFSVKTRLNLAWKCAQKIAHSWSFWRVSAHNFMFVCVHPYVIIFIGGLLDSLIVTASSWSRLRSLSPQIMTSKNKNGIHMDSWDFQ